MTPKQKNWLFLKNPGIYTALPGKETKINEEAFETTRSVPTLLSEPNYGHNLRGRGTIYSFDEALRRNGLCHLAQRITREKNNTVTHTGTGSPPTRRGTFKSDHSLI